MIRLANRHRSLLALVAILPAWLACTDAPTGPPLKSPAQHRVEDRQHESPLSIAWATKARALVAGARIAPAGAARIYALVSVAQYGAVVDADEGAGRVRYEARNAARRGAVAGASAQVLSAVFAAAGPALEQMVIDQAAATPPELQEDFARGVAAGRAMGNVMKAWGAADGFAKPWDRVPLPTGPGLWLQAPGVPPGGFQLPTMTPYFMSSPSRYRPAPPPAFGSKKFLAGLAATRLATETRGPTESAIANFWNFEVGTYTTPGYWAERASQLAAADGLDERETTHLFALLNATVMDALIGCFDAKYHYQLIRPTQADPLITLPEGLPGNPYLLPNHPSYPSGHSCVSSSAATILAANFPKSADVLDAEVTQAGQSRIIGGLHYPFDVSAGQTLGRRVAKNALRYDRRHGLLTSVVHD